MLFIGGDGPVTLAFLGTFNDNANALSYSFSVDIGPAAAKRFVVIGVDANMTVTINGVSAPRLHNFDVCNLHGAIVAAGDGPATVSISRAAVTLDHLSIAAWSVLNLHSTAPVDVCGTSAAGTPSDTMNVEAGGVALAIGRSNGGSLGSQVWAGVTQDGSTSNDGGFPFGAGSNLTPSTGTETVKFASGGVFKEFAAISFR